MLVLNFSNDGWKGLADEIEMEVHRISERNLGRDDRYMIHFSLIMIYSIYAVLWNRSINPVHSYRRSKRWLVCKLKIQRIFFPSKN